MRTNCIYLISLILFMGYIYSDAQYVRSEKYATEQQRRMQYALDDWVSYMETNRINSIAVGANYIYFATLDGGILRYHLYGNYWDYPYTTSNGLASNKIMEVAYSETGYLWAVTDKDTCIFKPAEEEWLCQSEANFWPYKYPKIPKPDSGETVEFNILYPRRFIGNLPHYFANGDYTITGDWILIDDNFDEFPIAGFLRDHWERVWFIINGLGIGIGNTYSQRMDVVPFGLSHIKPNVMQFQYNDLWIGGSEKEGEGRPGIVNWRDSDGGWYYYRARFISRLPSNNVIDIAVTGDSVWFASDQGVMIYDTRKNNWKNFRVHQGLYSNEILDLHVYKKTLFIGTDNGLNKLDLSTGIIDRVSDKVIDRARVYQIASQKDTIWTATNRGIMRYRDLNEGWHSVPTTAAIQDVPVLAVEEFDGEVWFTSPEGVFWWDNKSNEWSSFPQLGLEIDGPFFDLEVNWKSVWASSPAGLLKYDRQRLYWKLFTVEDGLLDNECHRLLLDGDYIWIANRKGITQFYWNNPGRID